jgi:diguanylate cyclase (GGDEF)-like protein
MRVVQSFVMSDQLSSLWALNAQLFLAGLALQLGVERWARYRRDRRDRLAAWLSTWAFALVVVLVANVWIFHASPGPGVAQVVLFVRSCALVVATLTVVPVAAHRGGRRVPRWMTASLVVGGVARLALWPTTELVFTHRFDADGAPVWGPWLFALNLPMLPLFAVVIGYLCHGWHDRVDQHTFRVGLVASGAVLVASLLAPPVTGELLTGFWLLPLLVASLVLVIRNHAQRERDGALLEAVADGTIHALVHTEARSELALGTADMAWWEYDLTTGAVAGSPELWTMLGVADAPPTTLNAVVARLHDDDVAAAWVMLDEARAGRRSVEVRWLRPNGAAQWIELSAVPVATGSRWMAGVACDVSDRHELDSDDRIGPRPGVVPASVFADGVDRAATADRGAAVMVVGLDGTTALREAVGRAAADELVDAVSHRLQWLLGVDDLMCRLSGDELGVLVHLRGRSSHEVAARWSAALGRPVHVAGRLMTARASIGVVVVDSAERADHEVLLQRADIALGRARAQHTAWAHFDPADERDALERHELTLAMPDALSAGNVEVSYQPIVDVATGRARSAEALLRWHHPVVGAVSPELAVAVAAELGLGAALVRLVLDRALTQLAVWREDHLLQTVSVNLPMACAADPAVVPMVADALARAGVPAHALVVEITEDALVEGDLAVLDTLAGLRHLGVGIAIDDFGVGASTLSRLQRFDVDVLKLDRSFLLGPDHGQRLDDVVGLALAVAHRLGLRVVAEGVEDDRARELLERHGCDMAQGFGVCPPASGAAITAWLVEHQRDRLPTS